MPLPLLCLCSCLLFLTEWLIGIVLTFRIFCIPIVLAGPCIARRFGGRELDWVSQDLARIPPKVDKTWRNEWQKSKLVEHKIKTLADARLKRCDHLAEPGQEVGRHAKRALFHIGTEVLLHCTSHTVSGLRAMPAQRPYVP